MNGSLIIVLLALAIFAIICVAGRLIQRYGRYCHHWSDLHFDRQIEISELVNWQRMEYRTIRKPYTFRL